MSAPSRLECYGVVIEELRDRLRLVKQTIEYLERLQGVYGKRSEKEESKHVPEQ